MSNQTALSVLPDGNGGLVPCPELMTEQELIYFLRIPQISRSKDPHNAVEQLKRFRALPRICICNKYLYPLKGVLEWIEHETINETNFYYITRVWPSERNKFMKNVRKISADEQQEIINEAVHAANMAYADVLQIMANKDVGKMSADKLREVINEAVNAADTAYANTEQKLLTVWGQKNG